MKPLLLILSLLLFSCSWTVHNEQKRKSKMAFTETEILDQLDLAFNGEPSPYFPAGRPKDIKYNFFLDLEHGYCETAGNRIHLYADSTRWAIVLEKSGYQNRGTSGETELNYVGNCINYPVNEYPDRNYIANDSRIILIEPAEFERIQNKKGKELETFELIDPNVKEVKIRGKMYPFNNNYKDYEKAGIKVRDYDNPQKLIGFGDLIRYLNETNPAIISATEEDIREHIPKDLPKLMTINEFHYHSAYDKSVPPSIQETYKLIARVLVTTDTTNWKPTQKPNNHWTNWESGNL